jgi:hypothetical protein
MGAWSELTLAAVPDGVACPGSPGLWRPVDGKLVFDLAPTPLASSREAWCAWAEACARGELAQAESLKNWRAPELDELAIDPGLLVAEAGELLAQARVVRTPRRLALRYEALGCGDLGCGDLGEGNLSTSRAAWLDELMADAARHWRLVRTGTRGGPMLEVNLTGAPLADLPALVPYALGALRQVAEWLLPPIHLLLDSSVTSVALGRPPARSLAAERNCS